MANRACFWSVVWHNPLVQLGWTCTWLDSMNSSTWLPSQYRQNNIWSKDLVTFRTFVDCVDLLFASRFWITRTPLLKSSAFGLRLTVPSILASSDSISAALCDRLRVNQLFRKFMLNSLAIIKQCESVRSKIAFSTVMASRKSFTPPQSSSYLRMSGILYSAVIGH